MHKVLVTIVLTTTALAGIMTMPPPAHADRVCGEPECFTAECWAIPGGRRCRRVCRRRCWNTEPRYYAPAPREPDPAPIYVPPQPRYEPPPRPIYVPSRARPGPEIDPALIIVGGAIGLLLLLIMLTRGSRLRRELEAAERQTESVRDLEKRMRSDIAAADRLIRKNLTAAYKRGRNSSE